MKGLGAACGCVGRCAVIGVRPYGQRVSIPGASFWASLGEFGRVWARVTAREFAARID